MSYFLLFLSAFGAGSLLPLQSEAVFIALLTATPSAAWGLLAVASVGNVLGSVFNWYLGLHLHRFVGRRWFPATPQAMTWAQAWFARYGNAVLLLSWVPIVGDPLTLVAGVLKMPLGRFLFWASIAKTGRYLVLYWLMGTF